MVNALTNNKAWFDKAFVSVSPIAGAEVQLRSRTTSFNQSGGNFDIEGLDTFGGKITRLGTKEDLEISFDGIPNSTQDFDWIFHGQTSSTEAITSSTTKKYRVTMLWTDEVGITAATQAIATASEAYRYTYAGAYCTSLEPSMNAGEELKATISFKLAYEDETGGQNFKKDFCDTSGTLSAISSYTTTTKF